MKNFNYFNSLNFHTNIRHQETVQILGTQNLYLRVVYAHIDNYTQVKGGWCGSQRDLAAQLEMPVGTINNQLNELLRRGLIVLQGNTYRSTREHPCSADEPSREQRRSADEPSREQRRSADEPSREQRRSAGEQRRSVEEQKCSANEQKCPAGEPPITPNIKEIKKERENNIARETIATQKPTPSSLSLFDEFIELYKVRSNNTTIPSDFIDDAKQKWESLHEWQKEELLNEMRKPNGFYKGSPLLTITYFKFQGPKNYYSLASYELDKAARENELWSTIVVPNERAWICTIEDIRRYGLKEITRFLPQN